MLLFKIQYIIDNGVREDKHCCIVKANNDYEAWNIAKKEIRLNNDDTIVSYKVTYIYPEDKYISIY